MGATVRAEIQGWKTHPELANIVFRLESVSQPNQFLDSFAEYAIARRFVNNGCHVAVEVTTQGGKSADLKVLKGQSCLFAHIKRLNLDENHAHQEKREPQFAPLENIKCPLYIELYLRHDLTQDQALLVRKLAKPFIIQAAKGDAVDLSDNGIQLGTARVLGDSGSDHVKIWTHFGMQVCTDRERLPKKLSQAYKQFMPNEVNIIFVAWNWVTENDLGDFDNVLLGSTCGEALLDSNMQLRSVPTGRKADGFWSGGKHPDSQAVCTFRFLLSTGEIEYKVWIRPGCESRMPSWFAEIF